MQIDMELDACRRRRLPEEGKADYDVPIYRSTRTFLRTTLEYEGRNFVN
jgi:hypothetical protein